MIERKASRLAAFVYLSHDFLSNYSLDTAQTSRGTSACAGKVLCLLLETRLFSPPFLPLFMIPMGEQVRGTLPRVEGQFSRSGRQRHFMWREEPLVTEGTLKEVITDRTIL